MVTLVDEFADIKIMRFEVPGWDGLTLRQKAYAYHLAEAAKLGRDITPNAFSSRAVFIIITLRTSFSRIVRRNTSVL